MAILFNQVPADAVANQTYVEVSKEKTSVGLQLVQQRIALIAQPDAALTSYTDGVPQQVFNADQVGNIFGFGTQIHAMARKLFSNSGAVEVEAFGLAEDVGDTASTGTVTFAGTATAAGEIALYIAGDRIAVTVAVGDTAENVVDALVAQVALQPEVVAALVKNATPEILDITANWKGATGDQITIEVNRQADESLPAGIASAVIVAMTGGAGNPDIQDALDNIAEDDTFTVVVYPWTDTTNLTAIEGWESTRWDPAVVKGFVSMTGFAGSVTTVTALTSTRNSWTNAIIGNQDTPQMPSQVAAAVAGNVAVSAGIDPVLQFSTLRLFGIDAPLPASRWENTERNTALKNGASTIRVSGGNVVIGQLRNTYQTTDAAASAPDVDRQLNTVALMIAVTFDRKNYFDLVWSRAKLANDTQDIPAGQQVMTPNIMKAELIGRYRLYLSRAWVENLPGYIESILVERDGTNPNRINSQDTIFRIGNLRISAFKVFYSFAAV